MTAKKASDSDKKPSSKDGDEEKKDRSPVVTQVIEVVEVVDDGATEQVPPQKETHHKPHIEPESERERETKSTVDLSDDADTGGDTDTSDDDADVDIDIIDEDVKADTPQADADSQEDADERKRERKTVESIFSKNDPDTMPEISVHKTGSKSSNRGLFIWAIGMFFMAITVGAGLLIFNRGGAGLPQMVVQPTETPTPSPSPSPTPTPAPVAKEDASVQVLNGSGQAGVAGTMQEFLEEAGYTVEDTGNADNYDYEETEISVKKSFEGLLEQLEEDLSEEYTIGSATADLPDDYEYDVRVIVGAE